MDNKVFFSAFNRSATLLQQSARNFAGNMEDARALYQETAFQISRQKESLTESGSFRKWAVGIMRNIFFSSLRQKKAVASQRGAEQQMPLKLERMLSVMETLEEPYRVPFWNHFMGLSEAEIATHTGLSVQTVKERIEFARQQLDEVFREDAITQGVQ